MNLFASLVVVFSLAFGGNNLNKVGVVDPQGDRTFPFKK